MPETLAGDPPLPAPVAPEVAQPPPAECQAYVAHELGCAQEAPVHEALEQALRLGDSLERDRALAGIQTCASFPAGLVLALRIEFGRPECGDALVGGDLPSGAPPGLSESLTAHVHAAHLSRLVVEAPRLAPPFSKEEFADFSRSVLNDWVVSQAQAIYKIAKAGAKLHGYARAVVAVEAGLADLRFVRVLREVPLPEDMAHDPELKEAYYSELDLALAPWKDRGRDAALVGLRDFAALGVLADARVDRARELLAELYGGRRIDALDALIVPPLPPNQPQALEQRLASLLPSPLLEFVIPELDLTNPVTLRALLERGMPAALRADLESERLEPARARLWAGALVRLGQRYWRASDFEAALRVLAQGEGPDDAETALVRGLAEALKGGPKDAAEMMLAAPGLPARVGDVQALDRLARTGGPWAAAAAFDAAYILGLAPPAGDVAFWQRLAVRYHDAARALDDPRDKARAEELALAADDTAAALSRQLGVER